MMGRDRERDEEGEEEGENILVREKHQSVAWQPFGTQEDA